MECKNKKLHSFFIFEIIGGQVKNTQNIYKLEIKRICLYYMIAIFNSCLKCSLFLSQSNQSINYFKLKQSTW